MNTLLLQSSLYGNDFVKYRKNHSKNERQRFSTNVRIKGVNEVPVVIDSVDNILSQDLAGPNAKRFDRNGKNYRFNAELIIEDVLLEVKQYIKLDDTKNLKIGLENGKILKGKNVLGDLYKKYKNQDDKILYLLLTEETTIYGYILSLLRYIFGQDFMNTPTK